MKKKHIEMALAHFHKNDPVLAKVVAVVGTLPKRSPMPDAFTRLCRAIIGQQLSVKAAATIWARLMALYGNPKSLSPVDVLKTSDDSLRGCGISFGKIASLKDLARHFIDERIDPKKFSRLSNEEITTILVRVRGIGVWSAHMYLIFGLGRPDVLPIGDLGFRNGIKKAYRLRARPTEKKMRALAKKWGGYESIAALYLWAYADVFTGY